MDYILNVFVIDDRQHHIIDATISVLEDASEIASATTRGYHDTPIHIQSDDPLGVVTLRASYKNKVQEATIDLAQTRNHTFMFDFKLRRRLRLAAVAAVMIGGGVVAFHEFVFPGIHAQVCTGETIHTVPLARIPGYLVNNHAHKVVVFVHGIRDNATHCWLSSTGQYWPALLAATSKDWDIYVEQYQDDITISEISNHMSLALGDVFESHDRAVVVAHSMGGLAIREFLLDHQSYAAKVATLLLVATPSLGSKLANFVAAFHLGNRQSDDLRTIDVNPFLQRQVQRWSQLMRKPETICGYETRRTWLFEVVSRESAKALCDGVPIPLDAGHNNAAKPECINSDQHRMLQRVMNIPFVAGHVAEYRGLSLAGVRVALSYGANTSTGSTDGNGVFWIDMPHAHVPDGKKIRLQAWLRGYESEQIEILPGDGTEIRLKKLAGPPSSSPLTRANRDLRQ